MLEKIANKSSIWLVPTTNLTSFLWYCQPICSIYWWYQQLVVGTPEKEGKEAAGTTKKECKQVVGNILIEKKIQYEKKKIKFFKKYGFKNLKGAFPYSLKLYDPDPTGSVKNDRTLSIIFTRDFLSLSICMAKEQWISGFCWHQNILIIQYQPRAMSFIFTWHNLITLISQGKPAFHPKACATLLQKYHRVPKVFGFPRQTF